MLSVEEALDILMANAIPLGTEEVRIGDVPGRVVAASVTANLTQPPFSASAMDGYAVRHAEASHAGDSLTVIGEAAAGVPFAKQLGPKEAVRIFTGGVVPSGADHILIQEEAERDGDTLIVMVGQPRARNIRPAGIDFHEGDCLTPIGTRLHEGHPSLFAAANLQEVTVFRKPRVAIFSNGDELKDPGTDLKPGQIINSNHYSLAALINAWGGEPVYLGCAADEPEEIAEMFRRGQQTDLILPVGGASVGDKDYVKSAFVSEGGKQAFAKVAMRPGKPVWHGLLGDARVIGLPGNPASALVTAIVFVRPFLNALCGAVSPAVHTFRKAKLTTELPANGGRETYLRASCVQTQDGEGGITPASLQDSSLLMPFATADVLIRRLPKAPALQVGEEVEYLPIR